MLEHLKRKTESEGAVKTAIREAGKSMMSGVSMHHYRRGWKEPIRTKADRMAMGSGEELPGPFAYAKGKKKPDPTPVLVDTDAFVDETSSETSR